MSASRRSTAARLTLAAVVALGLVAGCSATPPSDLVRRTVAGPIVADTAKPCTKIAQAGGQAADTSAPGAGSSGVTTAFDRVTNTVKITQGTGVTLAKLSKAVGDPDVLRELAPGEWLLGAAVEIDPGASLTIAAPDVRWLKMRSVAPPANLPAGTSPNVVALKAYGGGLSITGTCVTSWDDTKQTVDTVVPDGRPYLLARDGGQMTVDKAQLAYLGFGDRESYGLSWRTEGSGGHVADTDISHLYFGVYSFSVGNLAITGNDVHDSVLYGIDPHTGSHNLKIQGNTVHDNGKHGIILAEDCVDSVISDNIVYRNSHHGIVLYARSDRNTIENNETFLNASQGVNINESSNNAIQNNKIYDNGESGVGFAQNGQDNALRGNDIRGNKQDGVRLVSETATTDLRDNVIGQNDRYGVYVDTDGPFTLAGNTIFANRTGVLMKGPSAPSQNGNSIFDNRDDDVKNS